MAGARPRLPAPVNPGKPRETAAQARPRNSRWLQCWSTSWPSPPSAWPSSPTSPSWAAPGQHREGGLGPGPARARSRSVVSDGGGGFRVDPAALRQTSAKLHEHGEKVSEHGRTLKARTGGRVGHGPIGQVVDRFVTTAMTAVGEGFTKAASDLGHGFGKGLEGVARRAEKADGEAAQAFKALDHPHSVHAPYLTKDEPSVGVVAPL